MKKLVAALSLFFILQQGHTQQTDAADELIRLRFKEMQVPGGAVAVIKDGKIIKAKGYGIANLETGTAVTSSSVFMVASLSKQFIATAILLLQQEDKLSLSDKATRYIDSLPDAWKTISIQQLLSHTSGLVRDPADYHPYMEQPVMEVIRSMYTTPLIAAPGDKWLYSNAGYFILAELITRISGKPWNVFISERLFSPAGMTATRVSTTKDIIPGRVSGYHLAGKELVNAENWISIRPSGAFISTIDDMAKWELFLEKGNLLSAANRQLLFRAATLNTQSVTGYGMGWYIDSFLGRSRIHHDGQYPGFRADYERFTDDRLTILLLANLDNRGLESLALQLSGLYEPNLVTPTFTITAQLPPGTVTAGNAIQVTLSVKDDGKAAPGTVIEMEIWDATGKSVYKQNKQNENFAPGETKTFSFAWSPVKPGRYTVNVGVYGPHWAPNYTWKMNAAIVTVQ